MNYLHATLAIGGFTLGLIAGMGYCIFMDWWFTDD